MALQAKAARQVDGEQLIESASSDVGIVGLRVQRIEESLVAPRQRQSDLSHVHRGAHRGFDAALAGAWEERREEVLAHDQEIRGTGAERDGAERDPPLQPRPPVLDGARRKEIAGKAGAAKNLPQAPVADTGGAALLATEHGAPAQARLPGYLLRAEGQHAVRGQRGRLERALVPAVRADVVE